MNPKNQLFVREYLVDLNATQAAMRAGYKRSYARRACYVLLRRPDIAAAVAAGMSTRLHRIELNAERVLQELWVVGRSNMLRLASWDAENVSLRPSAEVSEEDAAAIAELSCNGPGRARIRLHDKLAALETLALYVGAAPQTGVARGADLRSAAQSRARAALREQIGRILREPANDTTNDQPDAANATATGES